jgi:hypothetical protein
MAIGCTDADLQAAADRFRLERGLATFDETLAWLSGRGMTAASWEELLRTGVLEENLLRSDAIGAAARERFEAAPDQFAKVLIGSVTVEDEGIAREIHLLAKEEGYSFDVLARRYSIEFADGDMPHPTLRRILWRCQAPGAIASAVRAEDFRGPLDLEPVQVGDRWCVCRIYEIAAPVFDAATEDLVRSMVLAEALRPHVEAAMASLLDSLGCPRPPDLDKLASATPADLVIRSARDGFAKRTVEAVRLDRMPR